MVDPPFLKVATMKLVIHSSANSPTKLVGTSLSATLKVQGGPLVSGAETYVKAQKKISSVVRDFAKLLSGKITGSADAGFTVIPEDASTVSEYKIAATVYDAITNKGPMIGFRLTVTSNVGFGFRVIDEADWVASTCKFTSKVKGGAEQPEKVSNFKSLETLLSTFYKRIKTSTKEAYDYAQNSPKGQPRSVDSLRKKLAGLGAEPKMWDVVAVLGPVTKAEFQEVSTIVSAVIPGNIRIELASEIRIRMVGGVSAITSADNRLPTKVLVGVDSDALNGHVLYEIAKGEDSFNNFVTRLNSKSTKTVEAALFEIRKQPQYYPQLLRLFQR